MYVYIKSGDIYILKLRYSELEASASKLKWFQKCWLSIDFSYTLADLKRLIKISNINNWVQKKKQYYCWILQLARKKHVVPLISKGH